MRQRVDANFPVMLNSNELAFQVFHWFTLAAHNQDTS
jgi:hypothetical protein